MRALPLLLLTLLAGPSSAQDDSGAPTGCKEDNTTCREDCSIEYGSSTRTYNKLGTCLGRCKQKYDQCRERHFALQERQKLGIHDPPAPTTPPPPPEEPGLEDSPEERPAPPASRSEPSSEPGVRRGVYRASSEEAKPEPAQDSESKPPAKSEPPAKAPPAAEASEDPLLDEEPPPPPPPPKPKPQAPPRPKPPPEPKHDISDWDPDGD